MYRRRTFLVGVALACSAAKPTAPVPTGNVAKRGDSLHSNQRDPVVTDGDKYGVILENERVRVLRYHDAPGAETHLHAHPDSVVYALGPFRRELSLGDGRSMIREFRAGDVAWVEAQSHVGKNIGTEPTDVLIVELKPKGP